MSQNNTLQDQIMQKILNSSIHQLRTTDIRPNNTKTTLTKHKSAGNIFEDVQEKAKENDFINEVQNFQDYIDSCEYDELLSDRARKVPTKTIDFKPYLKK